MPDSGCKHGVLLKFSLFCISGYLCTVLMPVDNLISFFSYPLILEIILIESL